MTITLSPLGELLAVEHWSTRVTVALSADMSAADIRTALLEPMHPIADRVPKIVHRYATPERYAKGAPTMVKVGAADAELAFGVPVPGRPDPDEQVAVSLPQVRYELDKRRHRPDQSRMQLKLPVTQYHVSRPVMDDVERTVVLALTHFRLIEAGHQDLSLAAASADYRDDVIITHDGRRGRTLWWAGKASTLGVAVPSPRRYSARFRRGELVLSPDKKQVP